MKQDYWRKHGKIEKLQEREQWPRKEEILQVLRM